MKTNYEILVDNIDALPVEVKSSIKNVDIGNGKKLFLVDNEYDGLPPQIKLHSNRLEPDLIEEITNEMNSSTELKVFLCVDFQNFINSISNTNNFNKVFKDQDINETKLNQIKCEFWDDYEDLGMRKAELKIIKLFGFSKYNDASVESVVDEEPHRNLYDLLQKYYFRNTLRLMKRGYRFDFNKNIIDPFHKLMSTLSKEDCLNTDNNNYSFICKESISDSTIQNMFTCMQFHTFFEEYVLSRFPNCTAIRNPLVLINPTINDRDKLDGYFELDGALIVDEENKLKFIESKNSRIITVDHLTHLLGKTNLIERVYELGVEKMLFSTGERHWIWRGIENKYKKMNDIKLFDLDSFKNDFS
jgi:hypothetical protein